MGTISISTPSDGQTIDAADVNSPLNTIVAAINGNLDDDNIKPGANINGTKLLANSIPPTAGDANMRGGWNSSILPTPNTVTYNGNRNYSLVFNTVDLTSYISPGMRLKATRTVTAPTQCTSLNGTTQFYSRASGSVAGMTFTDDFAVSAKIKLTAYPSVQAAIVSRFNGTSGWSLRVLSDGRIELVGFNAGGANFSFVLSYGSVPLNKWVDVAAQLDMSAFTATTTTSFVMIEGVDVPAAVTRGGTNPTALVQAGNLEIGSENGGSFLNAKVAQVAVYSAKVTQATIAASFSQTLSGSETSLISAYSFNNSINDLNANANNLTANGSAVATNADSPFAGGANASTAYTAGTTEFGEVFNVSFSTNTTVVVQVPDGYSLPTSGGISALAYSTTAKPLAWPSLGNILGIAKTFSTFTTTSASAVQVLGNSVTVTIPVGRKIKVSAWATEVGNQSAGAYGDVSLWDGTVGSGSQIAITRNWSPTALRGTNMFISEVLTPSTTTKTYNLGLHAEGGGTAFLTAANFSPIYIMVELEPEV